MDLTTCVIALLACALGLCVGVLMGQRQAMMRYGDLRAELRDVSASAAADSSDRVYAMANASFAATETVLGPVQESLAALESRLATLQVQESSWQAQLREQVSSVRLSGEELRAQTQALSDALRRPQVRGNWGEMQLRRSLELAGLTRHCTFEEQVSSVSDSGVRRPDVVVTMAGGRLVVIDSKTPLDAFLSAGAATSAAEQADHLRRHAAQVRQHMESLAAKTYWKQFDATPEFVVMFLPGEAIFAQACDTDPGLIEDAAAKNVLVATPTTLIAMLKTIGYVWSQQSIAAETREIHRLGAQLYDRIATAGTHLDKVGRSLGSAVGSYNAYVGSLESRVLVSARRLHDLGVGAEPLDAPSPVDEAPRPLSAPELLPETAERVVVEGPPGKERWVRPAVGE